MASKIPKKKFDDFDDVFSSMDTLNEATKFNNLNKGHNFFPEPLHKQKFTQGFKSVNNDLDPAQFRGQKVKVQSVRESKKSRMPNFNDLYQQIEQISGPKITPEEEEKHVLLYQRKSPDHLVSGSKSHRPRRPPPGFEKPKISESQKHKPTPLSSGNPPPQASEVSKFEPVTENVNQVADNIFFERFGVPITGIQSTQDTSEDVWDCSIATS